jgi:regulator of cell morphogenesis and NO signaling
MTSKVNKPINQIVDENYVNASVLHYFGIAFYDYSDKTLEQVCEEKGLRLDIVLKKMSSLTSEPILSPLSLNEYPVDLVIEYLKHMHHKLVKESLTYISNLILKIQDLDLPIVQDLKFVFPMFVQEFIEHIYEEEDTFFNYILTLNKAIEKGHYSILNLQDQITKNSLATFVKEHDAHDNVMTGLRSITNNYEVNEKTSLHLKVIYSALQQLESDLIAHARIEDEVLYPKAVELERKVKEVLGGMSN